jgi:hypothetical protein
VLRTGGVKLAPDTQQSYTQRLDSRLHFHYFLLILGFSPNREFDRTVNSRTPRVTTLSRFARATAG